MERLCERPGCSDVASVAYGMRPEDLVFWLDRLDGASASGGVLCQRHADSMVVPRSWTLDDLRDPDLHLFRPPAPEPPPRRTRRAPITRPASSSADGEAVPVEQLELGVTDDPTESLAIESAWSPSFDDGDDLNGLLSARSPLLARAFRGDDRPRS